MGTLYTDQSWHWFPHLLPRHDLPLAIPTTRNSPYQQERDPLACEIANEKLICHGTSHAKPLKSRRLRHFQNRHQRLQIEHCLLIHEAITRDEGLR
jgi:hypothetical protein